MNKKIFGFSPAYELRASSDGNKLALEGRAIVFEQPTVLYEIDGIQFEPPHLTLRLEDGDS